MLVFAVGQRVERAPSTVGRVSARGAMTSTAGFALAVVTRPGSPGFRSFDEGVSNGNEGDRGHAHRDLAPPIAVRWCRRRRVPRSAASRETFGSPTRIVPARSVRAVRSFGPRSRSSSLMVRSPTSSGRGRDGSATSRCRVRSRGARRCRSPAGPGSNGAPLAGASAGQFGEHVEQLVGVQLRRFRLTFRGAPVRGGAGGDASCRR